MKKTILKKLLVLLCGVMIFTAGCTGKSSKDSETLTGNVGTAGENASESTAAVSETALENYDGKLELDHSLEVKYSNNFGIDYYKGGYKIINVDDGAGNKTRIVLIPEGMSVPKDGVGEDDIVLCQPVENIMAASAPTIALLNAMGALDKVTLTTSDADSWYIDEIKQAVLDGRMTYVGSSTEPDYELITASKTKFAVYTRMLSDDVKEQFTKIGVDVLCDYSSVETEPMARVEWAYVYGALFDLEEEAAKLVEEQEAVMEGINKADAEGKSAAVFYITSSGKLYARNADDYMAMMVEYAGGEYALSDVGVGKTGTINMEMEAFYEKACNADYIIYVWSMGGKPETLNDLLEKGELFKDFKAVKEGNVWCTTPDYFQATNAIGDMIADINTVLKGGATDEDVTYLFRLQ